MNIVYLGVVARVAYGGMAHFQRVRCVTGERHGTRFRHAIGNLKQETTQSDLVNTSP